MLTSDIIGSEKRMIIDIGQKSFIEYNPNFLNEKESQEYLNELLSIKEWQQGVYSMYGKEVKTPRLLWAMRENDFKVPKGYSVTGNSEFTPLINKLKKKVEEYTDTKLKYAQLNYYRDGNDYIGWHSDNEVIDGDIIASISLGADRKFSLKSKDNTLKYDLNLKSGSLLTMDSNASKNLWKHSLPKMKTNDLRINITFRNK